LGNSQRVLKRNSGFASNIFRMTLTTFITLNAVLAATVSYAIVMLLGTAIRTDRVAPEAATASEPRELDRLAA
jgi:hypothetical protein